MSEPERFALVEFERDGLLLDLSSGSLFHLNESAAVVWVHVLRGMPPAAVAEILATRYRLPQATAIQHVGEALALDPGGVDAPASVQPFLYERAAETYVLSRAGTPLLTIDARGETVRLSGPDRVDARELPFVLQTVAPKLMALRGHFVLHASAVSVGRAVVAFCGKSGAGKTTTARALARAGATPVCEDKLVVRLGVDRIEGFVRGERTIMAWVAEMAAALAAGRTASCEGLDLAAGGESGVLTAIGFLDADRRQGGSMVAAQLGLSQATAAMFRNAFHGSALAEDWRQHLETAARASRLVATHDLTAPLGLEALASAASDIVGRGVFP
jgi:hypothetical protein